VNRFEIIFEQLEHEPAAVVREGVDDADMSEIRAIREESDAVAAIMRVSREITQQTQCACYTSS